MKGFKNSTRTQYMKGGSCEGYAKGGSVKGAAKIAKVMGEFKAGTLHSGSKKGPEVTSRKQATAIALSEARKAGAKIVKKDVGGTVTDPRQTRVDNRATDQAARMAERNARQDARVDERADRMAARDARQDARMEARDARRDAAEARRASLQQAVAAAQPTRGPNGAGFNARPAVQPNTSTNATNSNNPQRAVQPRNGPNVGMKKGGSLSVNKYKGGGSLNKVYTARAGEQITIPIGDIPIIDERKHITYEPDIVVTAPKAKVDAARYRRELGSDADIIARGNRSQAQEDRERRILLGYKKGGLSTMPKGKSGKR